MKNLFKFLILSLLLFSLPFTANAGQTKLNSKQLADSPANGYVLTTTGTVNAWTDPAGISTSPAGNDTELQYNDSGAFGATSGMVWNGTTLIAQNLDAEFNITSGTAMVVNDDAQNLTAFTVKTDLGPAAILVTGGGSNAEVAINEDGVGLDLRVETDNIASGFFVDASADSATFDASFYLIERAGPAAPVAGDGQFWVKNDVPNTAWFTDDGGTDFQLGVTHVSQYTGYTGGATITPAIDTYINVGTVGAFPYAGTGAGDAVGYGLPWNASIVGIAAQYLFEDGTDVATIDVYPREDGVNIAAGCKLTLPETPGLGLRGAASVTFAPGLHTVSADQTLGIYIDVIGDTTPDSELTGLTVTVYYHYTL